MTRLQPECRERAEPEAGEERQPEIVEHPWLRRTRRQRSRVEEQRARELHASQQVRLLLPGAERLVQRAAVCRVLVELDRLACELVEGAERGLRAAELAPQARFRAPGDDQPGVDRAGGADHLALQARPDAAELRRGVVELGAGGEEALAQLCVARLEPVGLGPQGLDAGVGSDGRQRVVPAAAREAALALHGDPVGLGLAQPSAELGQASGERLLPSIERDGGMLPAKLRQRALGREELAAHAVDLLLEERGRLAGELRSESQAAPDVLRGMGARHLLRERGARAREAHLDGACVRCRHHVEPGSVLRDQRGRHVEQEPLVGVRVLLLRIVGRPGRPPQPLQDARGRREPGAVPPAIYEVRIAVESELADDLGDEDAAPEERNLLGNVETLARRSRLQRLDAQAGGRRVADRGEQTDDARQQQSPGCATGDRTPAPRKDLGVRAKPRGDRLDCLGKEREPRRPPPHAHRTQLATADVG